MQLLLLNPVGRLRNLQLQLLAWQKRHRSVQKRALKKLLCRNRSCLGRAQLGCVRGTFFLVCPSRILVSLVAFGFGFCSRRDGLSSSKNYQADYADYIHQPGTYVGFADLAVLAMERKKDVLILAYDDSTTEGIATRSVGTMLEHVTSGTCQWPATETPDLNAPNTWAFAMVHSSYERVPEQYLNHFLPVYPKIQYGESWDDAVSRLLDKCFRKCEKARTLVENCDSDDDAAMLASLVDHHRQLVRKLEFFKMMVSLGMLPCEVPGDGNCGLWSFLAVQAGGFIQTALCTESGVKALRAETW